MRHQGYLDANAENFEEIKSKFTKGTNEEVRELATKLGYIRASGLYRAMRNLGINREFKYVPPPISTELNELETQVLAIVKKKPASVGEISRQIDHSSETVIKILDSLRHKHYMVELDKISRLVELPAEPRRDFAPTEFDYYHNYYKVGLVSDTHLGSKYQQLTALHDAYRIFDSKDVDFILHAGDVVDGVSVYRGQAQEVFLHGADEQRKYVKDVYPKSKKRGLKTYMIGGQHDRNFWGTNGYNIVDHICEERDDLISRGFYSAEFQVKGLPVRLEHPGGGVAYARSYGPQKIVENMMGFINTIPSAVKPILLIMGHWHTPLLIPVYMGVSEVSMPCFQAQTPYMQQHKNMMPTVGCAIAEIYLNEENQLSSVDVEFIIMNDRIKSKDY